MMLQVVLVMHKVGAGMLGDLILLFTLITL